MSRPNAESRPDPWRSPVIVAQIPDTGLHRKLEASAAELQAIAEVGGLREVLSAQAAFDVVPKSGGRIQVTGHVRARIGQICVVTLDPIESEIEEDVDLVFAPEAEGFYEQTLKYFDTMDIRPTLRGSLEADDITAYLRSPYELGWGKSVRFDHDFPGRAVLEGEAAAPTLQRVTLEFNSDDVIDVYASLFRDGEPYEFFEIPHAPRWIAWADKVMNEDGTAIGISSIPGYSLHFRRILTLAYVAPAFARPGSEVVVLWGNPGQPQKHIRATVRPAPYKTDARRDELTGAASAAAVPA